MNFSSDVIQRVTCLNVDIHGGAGVMKDVGAEKLQREVSLFQEEVLDEANRLEKELNNQDNYPQGKSHTDEELNSQELIDNIRAKVSTINKKIEVID